nr:hypothetical protein [Nocardioides daphniae]
MRRDPPSVTRSSTTCVKAGSRAISGCGEEGLRSTAAPLIHPSSISWGPATLRSMKARSSGSALVKPVPVVGSTPLRTSWRSSATSWLASSTTAASRRALSIVWITTPAVSIAKVVSRATVSVSRRRTERPER